MSAIDDHWRDLKAKGKDLGSPLSDQEEDAGSGGRVRRYQRGNIYWHPNTGAHEVDGGILAKYLQLGGPGVNPASGKRDLGFPTTDAVLTKDGRFPMNEFEWGGIYWVSGTGGASLHGDLFKGWKAMSGDLPLTGQVGYPITDHIASGGGEVAYFERGCIWNGVVTGKSNLVAYTAGPLLGRPHLFNPSNPAELRLPGLIRFGERDAAMIKSVGSSRIADLWKDRLVLQPVSAPGEGLPDLRLTLQGESVVNRIPTVAAVNLDFSIPSSVRERTLYNIAFRLPSGGTYVLAPHALYARTSWSTFGFIHATDLHISRRNEAFRGDLQKLGLADGVREYSNFQDNFRALISHANRLHAEGAVDFVVATGDLVDYVFEANDNTVAGGNFAFVEQLIRGQTRSPSGRKDEELRVPIFTVLGNHDYRPNAYRLLFEVDVKLAGGTVYKRHVAKFASHNLTADEAQQLEGGSEPHVEVADVLEMVHADIEGVNSRKYYQQRVNSAGSYVVEVGPHRLVMLDTKWDLGIPQLVPDPQALDVLDALLAGAYTDDVARGLAGSPNSSGFTRAELNLLRDALANAEPDALVIVGVHAPPLEPEEQEYPHVFRETEHPTADPNESRGYLRRHDAADDADWPLTGTPFFKRGGVENLLNYGIAKTLANEFLELCSGLGVPRPADVVLCGHIHDRVEFRVRPDAQSRGLLFYNDFYTENPSAFYPSKIVVGERGRRPTDVNIRVDEAATLNGKVAEIRDDRPDAFWRQWFELRVPPYAKPLNKSQNASQWWKDHRPLIVQTAALGPIDRNQRRDPEKDRNTHPAPTFQGCRLIGVTNNAIASIRYVTMAELRARPSKPVAEQPRAVTLRPT
jgi:predicted MPP superfamily phosphohydrolase